MLRLGTRLWRPLALSMNQHLTVRDLCHLKPPLDSVNPGASPVDLPTPCSIAPVRQARVCFCLYHALPAPITAHGFLLCVCVQARALAQALALVCLCPGALPTTRRCCRQSSLVSLLTFTPPFPPSLPPLSRGSAATCSCLLCCARVLVSAATCFVFYPARVFS